MWNNGFKNRILVPGLILIVLAGCGTTQGSSYQPLSPGTGFRVTMLSLKALRDEFERRGGFPRVKPLAFSLRNQRRIFIRPIRGPFDCRDLYHEGLHLENGGETHELHYESGVRFSK